MTTDLEMPEASDVEVHIKRLLVEGGRLEMQLDTDTNVIVAMFDALIGLLGVAPNYQQMVLDIKPSGEFQPVVVAVTVVRPGANPPLCIKCGESALIPLSASKPEREKSSE